MFTGIIECLGRVKHIEPDQDNIHFDVESPISSDLKIDQSVAHNGVCLTVVAQNDKVHRVTAIAETLKKSAISNLKAGDEINLERCLSAGSRFDGHIVQGHVDVTGICSEIKETNGSWLFTISHPVSDQFVTVEKGSITVNGVSLTVVNSFPDSFGVAIIPYTFEHTNFRTLLTGDAVNLEFDILGKYVAEMLRRRSVI